MIYSLDLKLSLKKKKRKKEKKTDLKDYEMSGTCRSTGKAVYRLLRNVKERRL